MPVIGGVYRLHFANTGSTWVNLTSETAPGSVATDVLIDPNNPKVFYAGLVKATDGSQNGVYKSVDGGESWQLLTNGIYNGSQHVGEWIALAMAPSSPQTVYTAIFQPGNSSTSPKLQRFRTSDSGNSWSMLSLPPAGNTRRRTTGLGMSCWAWTRTLRTSSTPTPRSQSSSLARIPVRLGGGSSLAASSPTAAASRTL